jgi:hypothetical protein
MVNKTGASRGVTQSFTDQGKGKSPERSRGKHFRRSESPSLGEIVEVFLEELEIGKGDFEGDGDDF